jgi:HPt (histidine-containing phosphotransfer) domain-containing protein
MIARGKMAKKQKIFRVDDEIEKMFLELMGKYQARSENHLFELIIRDVYELKKSKALVPFEELKETDKELKMALLKLGELQGVVSEKEKQIQRLEEQLKEKIEKKKGFWARLFGL